MGCGSSAAARTRSLTVKIWGARGEDELAEFRMGRVLGKGNFSVCTHAVHEETGKGVAIKTLDRSSPSFNEKAIRKEIRIMQKLKHPACMKLLGVYEKADGFHLVLELAVGGSLYRRIKKQGPLEEWSAASVTRQVLEATSYLHSQGIAHRDIKPHNILCMDSSAQITNVSRIKLADFGMSCQQVDTELIYTECMKSIVGTPQFAAPEMLRIAKNPTYKKEDQPRYTAKVDIWSIGCTMFHMLCGEPPFADSSRTTLTLVNSIISGEYKMDQPQWEHISDSAKNYCKLLMTYEPQDRPTAKVALWKGRHWSVRSHRKLETFLTTRLESSGSLLSGASTQSQGCSSGQNSQEIGNILAQSGGNCIEENNGTLNAAMSISTDSASHHALASIETQAPASLDAAHEAPFSRSES